MSDEENQMPDEDNQTPGDGPQEDPSLEALMETASDRFDVEIDAFRDITLEEMLYLLDQCPFLQMVGPEILATPQEMRLVESESGWHIHDYGDALSSSPGRFLFGGGDFRIQSLQDLEDGEGDDGEGDVVLNPGKGTMVNQAWVTARDMMLVAQHHGWSLVTIVDGHRIMQRSAWVMGAKLGIIVDGFEPSAEDYRIQQLVTETAEDLVIRRRSLRLD